MYTQENKLIIQHLTFTCINIHQE
uniref:Uncharacterized protein n=1 Tax=Arundo donax TaxID=35708 RepID=A0A0A9EID6_ARUDO